MSQEIHCFNPLTRTIQIQPLTLINPSTVLEYPFISFQNSSLHHFILANFPGIMYNNDVI